MYRLRLGYFALMLGDEIENRAPASVLLHGLATSTDCDEAILKGLRLRADRESAPALRALLPSVAQRPIGKRLAKLLKTLETLAPGAADPSPVPAASGVVATDGGPVLLAAEKTLARWGGASPEMSPGDDYHQALKARTIKSLRREDGEVIVLGAQAQVVEVMYPGDGAIWLLVAETPAQTWARRADIRFKPLPLVVDAAADAVGILDAAFTAARAIDEEKRHLVLETEKVTYRVERGTVRGTEIELVRLVPVVGG